MAILSDHSWSSGSANIFSATLVKRSLSAYVPRIKVIRSGKVRRAKLYYLRDRTGKSARIAEKIRKKIGIDLDVKPETVTEDNLATVKPEADNKKKETSTEEIISKAENKEKETPKADIKNKESEKSTESLTEKK